MKRMRLIQVEIDETGEASRIIRTGLIATTIFVLFFLLWAWWAPIRGAVIAEGMVKIEHKRKTIQHLENAVIKEIRVHEGEHVVEGQLLAVLQDAEMQANLTILRDQLAAVVIRQARLNAERAMAGHMLTLPDLGLESSEKLQHLYAGEEGLFKTKRKAVDDQLALIREQIALIQKEKAGIQVQIEAAKENIRYKQERVQGGETLNQKQFIEKTQYLLLKEDLANKKEALGQMESQLALSLQRESELKLREIAARNDYIRIANDEFKDTERQAYEFREKIRPAEISLNRYQLTAPVDGQVIDLRLSTVGGVVRSGDPIMDIVPDTHDLILEVKVRTLDIELVYLGQKADVQLLAYNSRKVPHIPGTVVYVSGDAIEDKSNSANPAYFLAHIRVEPSSLETLSEVDLSAGMPVTAFIQTRDRTFMDMILKPIEDSLARGLRRD
jgi:epimerase transport system membrane fusion protein